MRFAITFCAVLILGSFTKGQAMEADTLAAHAYYTSGESLAKKGYETRQSFFFDSARNEFNRAATAYVANEDWDRFFGSILQVSYLLNHEFQFPEAKAYLDSIESNYGDKMDLEFKSYIKYYGTHAWVNLQMANFMEADAWFNKVLSDLDRSPNTTPDNYLWTYYYMAVMYYRIGQNDLSLKYLELTEQAGNKYDDSSYLGRVYNIRGIISRKIGEYEKALEYYTIGYQLQSHVPKVQLTPFLNNFSWLHHHLGNDSLALYYANDGLQALEDYSQDYYTVESTLRNTKAEILIDLDRFEEAHEALTKNLEREFARYGVYGRYSIQTQLNMGLLESTRGNFEKSEAFYSDALITLHSFYGENSPKMGEVYRNVANNYLSQEKYDQALDYYQLAIGVLVPAFENTSQIDNPPPDSEIIDKLELLKVFQDKSAALLSRYRKQGEEKDLTYATETNMAGIDLLDQVRQNLYYGESKQVLSGLMKPLFGQTISLAVYGMKTDPASLLFSERIFHAVEKSKSYVLTAALQESSREGHTQLSDSLLKEQELLFLRTEYLSKKQNDLRANSATDSIDLYNVKQELLTAREEYEEFKSKLTELYPEFGRARFGGNELTLAEIQERLHSKELIVDYFAGSDTLYALAITNDEVTFHNLGAYSDIEKRVIQFSQFSIDMNPDDYQELAFGIFTSILQPMVTDIEKTSITIIPDGALGYLPFDALVMEKVQNPTFLSLKYGLERFSFGQHYSASLYAREEGKHNNAGTFIGYAPDFDGEQTALLATRSSRDSAASSQLVRLPYARSEVEKVSTMLQGEAIVGKNASEGHFKATANGYEYLHVASHSVVDNSKPLFSKLVFNRNESESEDGLLHAYELYSMTINSDLVTLSACNTGVGQFQNGEGILSLARGFIYAGASSVLMSLWEVADQSTSIIMEDFYGHIDSGLNKAEAIRQAKLDYLNQADHVTANPYYWAGFTYLGVQPQEQNSSYWPFLVVLIVIALAAVRRRKRNTSV